MKKREIDTIKNNKKLIFPKLNFQFIEPIIPLSKN